MKKSSNREVFSKTISGIQEWLRQAHADLTLDLTECPSLKLRHTLTTIQTVIEQLEDKFVQDSIYQDNFSDD